MKALKLIILLILVFTLKGHTQETISADSMKVVKAKTRTMFDELFMFKIAKDVIEIRQLISDNVLGDSVENYMNNYNNALFFINKLDSCDIFWNRVLGRKKYKVPSSKLFLDSREEYINENNPVTSIDFDIVLTPQWVDPNLEKDVKDYTVKITPSNYENLDFTSDKKEGLNTALNSKLTVNPETPKDAKVNDAVFVGLKELRVLCKDLKFPNFHITVGSDTTKFINDSEIFINQRNGNIKLTLHYDNPLYPMDDIKWEVDGSKIGNGLTCNISLQDAEKKKVSILRKGFSIFESTLDIYENPIVVFEKSSTFNGIYGFDNADYDALKNSGDYEQLNLYGHNNNDYNVPLITTSSTANLSIDVKSLKSKANNDANFKVRFIPSTSDIKINNLDSLVLNYTQLRTLNSLQIESINSRPSINFANLDYVGVYTQDKQLIGKLTVVNKEIVYKEVVFVYVDNGNGTAHLLNHNLILNFLNNNSHNQFFINWDVSSVESINTNITASNTTAAINALIIPLAKQTTRNINTEPDIYFYFITDFEISVSGGNVGGGALTGGNYGAIFKPRKEEEVAHEFGHLLGLPHSFPHAGSTNYNTVVLRGGVDRSIPQKQSNNFMDYFNKKEVFYLYQWYYIFNNH